MLPIFIISVLLLITSINGQQTCNGYAELCDKPYNTVTYVTTHNSYGYVANPASNQLCPITTQLDDGVRGLKLSAIKYSNATTNANGIYLCHTSCTLLNAGPALDTLIVITEWVKNHPNEVITIIWNNLGEFGLDSFNEIYTASGLVEYSYVQAVGSRQWPTLQELITSGKRVINFVDEGADQSVLPWFMKEFDYVFETPYNNFNESSFNCVIDRPTEPHNNEEMMYLLNHFLYRTLTFGSIVLDIPQKGTADIVNAQESLLKHAETCTATFGRRPNFLKVDFFNKGATLQIAATLNNVTYNGDGSLQCNAYIPEGDAYTDPNSMANQNILYMSTLLLSLVATSFFAFF
ncbi:PLC-like phosphodiesterase [Pilobolus umbonatus]|nr:PLC-like phosphodiesterase [Pilobolus umbonatus]